MNETLVSASTAGLVEMIQTWRWSNKVLESASSLRSPSPLPPKPWKPSSWSQWRRPGVPAAVHGAQAALPHRRRPARGWQFQGGIGPTCRICSPENFKVWIFQRTVSVSVCYKCFCSLWNASIKLLLPAAIRVCLFCERRFHAGVQVFETKVRIVYHCQGVEGDEGF